LTACFVDSGVSDATTTETDTSSGTTGSSTGATDSATSTTGTTSTTGPTDTSATTSPPPICGDGMLDPGEACDDGNQLPGDGCDEDCQIEPRLLIFLSGRANGNLGGTFKASEKCQGEAQSAGLPGTFIALLSAPNQPFAEVMPEHDLPYYLPGRGSLFVTKGREGLLSDAHQRPINRGPDGADLPVIVGCSSEGDGLVWTGTLSDGAHAASSCEGFTKGDPGVTGVAGNHGDAGAGWADACAITCDHSLRLYCVQIP